MPRRRTSLKSQRASKTKHAQNLKTKQQLKRTIKKFQALVADKNSAEAKTLLKSIFSQLDKASKKGRHAPRYHGQEEIAPLFKSCQSRCRTR
jgi:ribosomal protein S20